MQTLPLPQDRETVSDRPYLYYKVRFQHQSFKNEIKCTVLSPHCIITRITLFGRLRYTFKIQQINTRGVISDMCDC